MDALAGLYEAYPFWIWGGVGAALLAAEVLTGSGWLLWAAASAAVVAVLSQVLGLSFSSDILIYAALTLASTLLARRYLPASAHGGGDINDAIGRLIGRRGVAVARFEARAGRVMVEGKEWLAELEDSYPLEVGDPVQVTGLDGARLLVRRLHAPDG